MSPVDFKSEEIIRVNEVKTYLINNLDKRITIKDLARRAALNRERFRECFFYLFGLSLWDFEREVRMKTGYFLLRHSNKPIKEISFLTGFKSSGNFSTAFKKYYKQTPDHVRRHG